MHISLRAARVEDTESLAHILVTTNARTFAGIVPEQCLTFTEAQSAANWRRTLEAGLKAGESLTIARNDASDAVGYVFVGPGELKQIHVLPQFQRQGVGKLLLHHAMEQLAVAGIFKMFVEVLQCNPNRGFYERRGAKYVSQRTYDWDGVEMVMLRYEWEDTRSANVR